MPREKKVQSLQDSCLSKICQVIKNAWWINRDDSHNKKKQFLVTHCNTGYAEQFQILPARLLEAIYLSLPWKFDLLNQNEHLLEKFLLPQLKSLILYKKYVHAGIPIAAHRGLTLKKLEVSSIGVCPVLMEFLPHPSFSRLQVVNFYHTDIDDDVLSCVGANCKELRELGLSHCDFVTQKGIEQLCGAASSQNPSVGRQGCKLLEMLKLTETRISAKGVVVALNNLPHLQVLEYTWRGSELTNFQSSTCEDAKFILKNLKCNFTSGPSPTSIHQCVKEDLAAFTSRCPSLTQVHIEFFEGDIEDEDLMPLQKAKNLSDLQIKVYSRRPDRPEDELRCISFAGGILPLLRQVGGGLRNLKLRGLNDVDISAIAKYCPGMHTLHLSQNMCYTRTDLAQPPLWNLEVMRLNCELTSSIENGDLLFLLSSPSLTEISISCCPCMDDSVFQAMAGLPRLELLDLFDCWEITSRKIDFLMTSRNPLRRLRVRCEPEGREINRAALEEEARNHNWDFELEVQEYFPGDSEDDFNFVGILPDDDSMECQTDDSDYDDFYSDEEDDYSPSD